MKQTICKHCGKDKIIDEMDRCDKCMDKRSESGNYIMHNTTKISNHKIESVLDFFEKNANITDREQLINLCIEKYKLPYRDVKVANTIMQGKGKDYEKYRLIAERKMKF